MDAFNTSTGVSGEGGECQREKKQWEGSHADEPSAFFGAGTSFSANFSSSFCSGLLIDMASAKRSSS
jgi:hypothetical protein